MGESTKKTQDPHAQADKFRELARSLECDEDDEAFKATVKKVATAPRSNPPPKPD